MDEPEQTRPMILSDFMVRVLRERGEIKIGPRLNSKGEIEVGPHYYGVAIELVDRLPD